MTANVKYTVEQRRLFRNSRCLSTGSDSLYLQFKSIIWAQSYPRKYTNCTNPLQEGRFPTPLRHAEKQAALHWNWERLGFFTSTAKIECWQAHLMLRLQLIPLTENIPLNIKKWRKMCQEMLLYNFWRRQLAACQRLKYSS